MMRTAVVVLVLVLAVAETHAWVVVPKNALQKAAAAATISAALWTAPLVSNAANESQFAGSYSDPKHENCLRVIQMDGNIAKISGTDGTPACPADGSNTKQWSLVGKVQGDSILVDFSPKGGPKDLKGKFDGTGIQWPDGNKWSFIPDKELPVW